MDDRSELTLSEEDQKLLDRLIERFGRNSERNLEIIESSADPIGEQAAYERFTTELYGLMVILDAFGIGEFRESRRLHRAATGIAENIRLESRMRDLGCDYEGDYPPEVSERTLGFLESLDKRYGRLKPYRKDVIWKEKILASAEDAVLNVDIDAGLGGGIGIIIRFEGGVGRIERASGIGPAYDFDMTDIPLSEEESDLLLDLVAAMKYRGDCTSDSDRSVCDGGGCSMTFRGKSVRTFGCESYFNTPYDLERLCRFAEYLVRRHG